MDAEQYFLLLVAIIRRAQRDARGNNSLRAEAAQEFLSEFLAGMEA